MENKQEDWRNNKEGNQSEKSAQKSSLKKKLKRKRMSYFSKSKNQFYILFHIPAFREKNKKCHSFKSWSRHFY